MDEAGVDHHIRVAVMTEKRLFRDALVACLGAQDALSVVGHAGTTEDLLVLCALRSPDVVVVADGGDVRTAQGAATAVRERHPRARVVLVYEHLSPEDLAVLWRAGVDTLVPASHGLEALVVLLRRSSGAGAPTNGEGLTDREREILALVGAGHTVCRIADLLQTSVHEVENAKRRIYRKLDVASHSQAVARAAALGMMDRAPVLAPRAVRDAGIPLAVLRGPQTATRQRAVIALLAHGVPFALEQPPAQAGSPKMHGAEAWHRGPTVLVLVEPRPQDWPVPPTVRSPVVLVCAGDPTDVDVLDALPRGLAAVVPAERVAEDLVPAMTLAARGYLTLDGARVRMLLANRRVNSETGLPALTARESDILRSIAAGHTVRQTARSLGIAEKTVENTQARLFRKLGAHNRAGALAAAHGWGLIELGGVEPARSPRRPPGSGTPAVPPPDRGPPRRPGSAAPEPDTPSSTRPLPSPPPTAQSPPTAQPPPTAQCPPSGHLPPAAPRAPAAPLAPAGQRAPVGRLAPSGQRAPVGRLAPAAQRRASAAQRAPTAQRARTAQLPPAKKDQPTRRLTSTADRAADHSDHSDHTSSADNVDRDPARRSRTSPRASMSDPRRLVLDRQSGT